MSPSPKEAIASSGISGSQSRYLLTTPRLSPRVRTPKVDLTFPHKGRPARPNRVRHLRSLTKLKSASRPRAPPASEPNPGAPPAGSLPLRSPGPSPEPARRSQSPLPRGPTDSRGHLKRAGRSSSSPPTPACGEGSNIKTHKGVWVVSRVPPIRRSDLRLAEGFFEETHTLVEQEQYKRLNLTLVRKELA